MAGDKDTLIGMGFEAARVECALPRLFCVACELNDSAGALKATGNRGLQPAMDHILEHEGQSVPDMSGVTESTSSTAMDVDDDDDDADALKALGEKVANNVEAKVRILTISWILHKLNHLIEHQMLRVWEDLQKHSPCQLPR